MRLPTKARLYVSTVVLLGLVIVLHTPWEVPSPLLPYLVLVLTSILTLLRPIRLSYGMKVDLSTGVLLALLTFYGPGAAMLASTVTRVVHAVRDRWLPVRTAFNIAQYVVALGVAHGILLLGLELEQPVAGLLAAGVAFSLVNFGLVNAAASLAEEVPFSALWDERFGRLFLSLALLAVLGAITGHSIRQQAWALGTLALGLGSGYLTLQIHRLVRRASEEARQHQLLHRAMASPSLSPRLGIDPAALLAAAAEIVDARDGFIALHQVELRLKGVAGPDAWHRGDPGPGPPNAHRLQTFEPVVSNHPDSQRIWIPLLAESRAVGAIDLLVGARVPVHRFRTVLTSLARQASSLLERERLHRQQRGHAQALVALMRTVREINAELSLEPLLERIVDEAARSLSANVAAILLLQPDGDYAVRAALGIEPEQVAGNRLPGEPLRQALGQGQEHRPFLAYDPTRRRFGNAPFWEAQRLRSVLLLPLWKGDLLEGVLGIAGRQEPRTFTDLEIEIGETLAAAASIALRNASLYEALEEKEQRRRGFLDRLIAAQEEERKMVAYDLHDGLLQYIVAAHMLLGSIDASRLEGRPEAAELHRGLQRLDTAMREGRRIISELRPSTLDTFGLARTVEHDLAQLRQELGWQVTFRQEIDGARLPTAIELTAFRILQEALTNAKKHARAERVEVSLLQRDGQLLLRVRDWGRGFDPSAVRAPQAHAREEGGLGLSAIRQRAEVAGGWCRIESRPGRGTTVEVGLPLER